jgi:hypothetical protein
MDGIVAYSVLDSSGAIEVWELSDEAVNWCVATDGPDAGDE